MGDILDRNIKYMIIRNHADGHTKVMRRGLTLCEAMDYVEKSNLGRVGYYDTYSDIDPIRIDK